MLNLYGNIAKLRLCEIELDENTIDLIRKISKTATLATLRELTRAYHIAFVVSQNFTENGKTYNVGDLYISKESLTFDEAYAILISSGIIDNLHDVTKNIDLINSINNVLNKNNVKNLADLVKEYTNKGYFKKKASGIYADSALSATAGHIVFKHKKTDIIPISVFLFLNRYIIRNILFHNNF